MPPRASPRPARAWRPCLLLVALASGPACSSSALHPVPGTVIYKGAPIKRAVVVFHPVGGDLNSQRPSGVTGEDGTFSLTTGVKDGAPRGEYRVTVVWPAEQPAKPDVIVMASDSPSPPDRLGGRYADS